MLPLKVNKEKLVIWLLLGIFLLPSLVALFHSGFPTTDDGNWMIIRFAAFFTTLRHGQFPVRFLLQLNHGYGYPVADFLYPLFMYVGVLLHIIGFGFINTIKIILGGSLLFSGIFCFLWLKKLFKNLPSFVGALSYVLFPYHVYDVYQRGSVGEVVALAIVPFIFWQIERKSILFISIGLASLILAHNTLALLFLPFIIIYSLLKSTNKGEKFFLFSKKVYLLTGLPILLGLGLSAFFWIPALFDKQFTVFDSIKVSDYTQYFLSSKNFGIVGVFALMVSIIGVSFAFKKGSKHDIFFLAIVYIGLFFSLPISSFLWKLLPLPQLVQFPFRFLSLTILGTSFVTAFMIDSMKSSLKFIIGVLCIFLLYVSSYIYLWPKSYQIYPDSYYATNQDTTTVKNEYMPKWVKQLPVSNPSSVVQSINGNAVISDVFMNNANKIDFTSHTSSASIIRVNSIYFPGWNIFVNNKKYPFTYSNPQGVMDISLSPGDYTVSVRFGETPIRVASDIVTLVSIAGVLALGIVFIVKRSKIS